jgi:hypothetical protein
MSGVEEAIKLLDRPGIQGGGRKRIAPGRDHPEAGTPLPVREAI